MKSAPTLTVYLIHFSVSYHHARHYLGVAVDLPSRLTQHAKGQGARLMQVVTDAGIKWEVVRTWTGDRKLERRLKNRKSASRFCPLCAGALADRRANYKDGEQ